jgi:hypothetical protein
MIHRRPHGSIRHCFYCSRVLVTIVARFKNMERVDWTGGEAVLEYCFDLQDRW